MNSAISANNLSKTYSVPLKEKGLTASLQSLFKREYKKIEAVKSVNFEIAAGEIVGFIGPNGAGKTTTLKMLSGILYPTAGDVKVLGFTPSERKEEYLKQISLVMGQKNQLWWDLPAIETFELQKEIYEIPEEKYKTTLEELTEMLDVKNIVNQPVRQLSLGQRMKCEIIAALIFEPKVLFLDEPTIGLDIVTQKKLREFIKTYNKKHQAAVILTSHYMDVQEICERVIMINHGEIMYDGKINELIAAHANYKILVPIFNTSDVRREDMQAFGEVKEFDYPRAVIHVPRHLVSQTAAELLSKFDIDDLDINEPELEDIIAREFEKKG